MSWVHRRTRTEFRQPKYSFFAKNVQLLPFLKLWLYRYHIHILKTWNFINWKKLWWKKRQPHMIAVRYIRTYVQTYKLRIRQSMNLIASPAQSSIYRGLERFWKIENDLKIKIFWKRRKIDWKLVKKHITRYLRLRRDRLDQNNNAPSFSSTGWVPVRVPWKKVFVYVLFSSTSFKILENWYLKSCICVFSVL